MKFIRMLLFFMVLFMIGFLLVTSTSANEPAETAIEWASAREGQYLEQYDGYCHNLGWISVTGDQGSSPKPTGSNSLLEEWVVSFEPERRDNRVEAMVTDHEGNIIVTGTTRDGIKYATVKYDPEGNELWSTYYRLSYGGYSRARALAVDRDGNVFVTGTGPGPDRSYGFITVKYDGDTGEELWDKYYNSIYKDRARCNVRAIAVDESGDDIPGSKIELDIDYRGVVDAKTGPNNIYAIDLEAGYHIIVSLTDEGVDSETGNRSSNLSILSPSSTTLDYDSEYELLASDRSRRYNYDAEITYTPETSGIYYIWIEGTDWNTPYVLRLMHKPTYCFIDAAANPQHGGSVSGSGYYNPGETVTLTAEASQDAEFINWTENGQQLSKQKDYTFSAESNRNLQANFIVPSDVGYITIDLRPSGAIEAGAKWSLTDGPDQEWKDSGDVTDPLPANQSYNITFQDVPVEKPKITAISPEIPQQVPGLRQWIEIQGTSFAPEADLIFYHEGKSYPISWREDRNRYQNSALIKVKAGLTEGDWGVQVVNPGDKRSDIFSFKVSAPEVSDVIVTANIGERLLELIDTHADDYYNEDWNMTKDQFKAWIAAIAQGEGGHRGYVAHSSAGQTLAENSRLRGTDIFAHRENGASKFHFSTGIGPFQLDRGGDYITPNWDKWLTIEKLDVEKALISTMEWHKNRFRNDNPEDVNLLRFSNLTRWFAVKRETCRQNNWRAVTGLDWDDEKAREGTYDVKWQVIREQLKTNTGGYRWTGTDKWPDDITYQGEQQWNIKNYPDDSIEGLNERLPTYRINARSAAAGTYSYYYTYHQDKKVEAWVLDDASDDGHLTDVFIRDLKADNNKERPIDSELTYQHGEVHQSGRRLDQPAFDVSESFSNLELLLQGLAIVQKFLDVFSLDESSVLVLDEATDREEKSVTLGYNNPTNTPLTFSLAWEEGTVGLNIYTPEGDLYASQKSDQSPLQIDVPLQDVERGLWKYEVTAKNISSDDSVSAMVSKTKPQVVSTTPAGGATDIGLDDIIEVEFDRPINLAELYGITVQSSEEVIAGSPQVDGHKLLIDHSGLNYQTDYIVNIPEGFIRCAEDSGENDQVTFSFTTKETPTETGVLSVGLYDPTDGVFHLRNETPYRYGPRSSHWLPVAGDWNGDGDSDVGLYDPADGVFHLRNETPYRYGPRNSSWLTVTGDWNGDGTENVGLYDPNDGVFHLKGQEPFRYGPRNSNWLPISGDWNGDGYCSVGLYDPSDGVFHLSGEEPFRFGPRSSSWPPLTGDWNGNGKYEVGLYDLADGVFHLKDIEPLRYGPRSSDWLPVSGQWEAEQL